MLSASYVLTVPVRPGVPSAIALIRELAWP